MDTVTDSPNVARVRVLIVDDHPNMAMTLARAITQSAPGIEVISATSGEMALERLRDAAVDLVITDMMMPNMNGLELIERLQSHPGGRPAYTILMTAYDVPGLKETARRLKVNETILKPFRPERICQIVGKLVDDMRRVEPLEKPGAAQQLFKILVADDVPDNVSLLSRYLEKEGYIFVTASNGAEALEKTRSEMPDLILLDVNMPEKDGFQVLREIRADSALEHIPVIILTAARPDAVDVQFGLNLGADDYVTKPFDRRELLARIRTKLRAKETEAAVRRRYEQMSVLPEIGRDLSARLDINDLADVVLRRTVETLGAMYGHIIILNSGIPFEKTYRLVSSVTSEIQLPCFDPLVKQIEAVPQILIIEDACNDARWQASASDPVRSAVIVPIMGRLELIGLLVLTHEQLGYFKSDHLLLVQAIASQAAIAVENAALHASVTLEHQRTAAILQSAADAILIFDSRGCLVSLNPAGEKLFADDDVKPGHPLRPGGRYEALIELLEAARSSGHLKDGEFSLPDERTFTAFVTPIPEDGFVAILHDVTHFKQLERVKNEFIATLSHDLKNPLSVITGFTDLLHRVGPLNQTQIEYTQRIQAAGENMNSLVQNLMELVRLDIDAGMGIKRGIVNLCELISGIAAEFRPQAEFARRCFKFRIWKHASWWKWTNLSYGGRCATWWTMPSSTRPMAAPSLFRSVLRIVRPSCAYGIVALASQLRTCRLFSTASTGSETMMQKALRATASDWPSSNPSWNNMEER